VQINGVLTPVASKPVGNPNTKKPHASSFSSAPVQDVVSAPVASPSTNNNGDKPSQNVNSPTSGTADAPSTSGGGDTYKETEKCLADDFTSNGCSCFRLGGCARRLENDLTCKSSYAETSTYTPSAWKAFVDSYLQTICPNAGPKIGALGATVFFSPQQNSIDQRAENCLNKAFSLNSCDCSKARECTRQLEETLTCKAIYAESPFYSPRAWREFVNAFLKEECPNVGFKVAGFKPAP
jgi:hypothetical protein